MARSSRLLPQLALTIAEVTAFRALLEGHVHWVPDMMVGMTAVSMARARSSALRGSDSATLALSVAALVRLVTREFRVHLEETIW